MTTGTQQHGSHDGAVPGAGAHAPVAPVEPPTPPLDPRTAALLVAGVMGVVLFAVMTLLPVPYAVMRPGPVRDVLGETAGSPLIEVQGERTYPTEGRLDLLTVRIDGGPGHRVGLEEVLAGWLDREVSVRPERELFPPDRTEDQVDQESAQAMVSSQENATAAALFELGIPVPTTLTVVGFSEEADAADKLREDDVITALDGEPVTDLPQLRDLLQERDAGSEVTVSVQRDGDPLDVPVTTMEGEEGQTLLGVLIDPTYDFPVDVRIKIEKIGGPSAGMMFSLGIIDKLTPGALTGGEHIAGTGSIDTAGVVGPIGGVQQKLVAAKEAGARWFLAPAENCDEVVGHVPEGLRVVKVATLHEARVAVEAIGQQEGVEDLPTCE